MFLLIGTFVTLTVSAAYSAENETSAQTTSHVETLQTVVAPFLTEHCVVCHNTRFRTSNLDLQALAEDGSDGEQLEVWARVVGKLRGGQMPPPGRPRPSDHNLNTVTTTIENYLTDVGFHRRTDPGRVTARRLNRVEYNNTVRSLLGIHSSPADEFPLDDAGYGFDNIADVLSVSPLLMEKYIAAAKRLSYRAVFGEPLPEAPSLLARYMGKRSHDAIDALADGTILPYSIRGALYGDHLFPWNAEYEFRFRAANYRRSRRQLIASGLLAPEARDVTEPSVDAVLTEAEKLDRFMEEARQSQPPVPLVATLDGKVFREERIEGSNAFGYDRGEFITRLRVDAGIRHFRISYPETANLDDPRENILADGRRVLYVDYVDIVGPFDPEPNSPSGYDQIFVCRHRPGEHGEECAGEIVSTLARRAYRRPVTQSETEPLVALVRQAEANGDGFEEGVRLAIQAVLLSPHFLFRIEKDPSVNTVRALDDHELASRLSYFLWADMPDEHLFTLADEGRLSSPQTLKAEVQRMLADPKATNLATDFASQWLQLRGLTRIKPDPTRFPTVDDELLDAMLTETELFIEALIREDRSALDLIDAPFTFLNGPLARHYGIPGIDGETFQRVALEDPRRRGILSHGSVLTVSSYPTRTSPVLRGKWVLENLLGAPPPDPPPDIPALDDTDASTSGLTLREQMEIHRTNPSCAVCHSQIDPIGFGLEKYDATGAWRTHEADTPINDTGTLPDGTSFHGPAELKQALRARTDAFTRNLAEKLLTYALGRGLEFYDDDAVKTITDIAETDGYRWSAFINAVVDSEPFRLRRSEEYQP